MKKIVIIGIILVGVGAVVWYFSSGRTDAPVQEPDMFTQGDPVDLTLDMMSQWRDNRAGTSTVPLAGFIEQPLFSPALRTKLNETPEANGLDPLLCQPEVPPRVVGRMVLQTETEAQVLVFARGLETLAPQQSLVTLRGNGEGGWVISTIACVLGETAPEVEFTFDREGYLLKSVPPPYQAGDWHIVFAQDGQMGYVAPLTFTGESLCIEANGVETVCAPDSFVEPSAVLVRGEMTEAGVIVNQVRFSEN